MTKTYAIDARTADKHFPGIGRYVANLLRAIPRHLQPEERILYLCSREQREELNLPGSDQMSWLETTASPFGLAQQWQVPRLLRAHGIDVYHSPYYLMPYWPGVPTVLTVYDLIPMHFPEYVSRQARLLFRLTTSLALRRAQRVLAISRATRADYLSHFDLAPERISTTHLAAASSFRPADDEQIAKTRHEYELAQPFVLYVGSNKQHKNLVRLVRAWAAVLERIAEPHTLVLAGRRDPRYSEVEHEIARLELGESVRQIQDAPDETLAALYSGAQLFVFPSLYEGFGLPVLEAMSCGAAVACANRSSLPEIVGDSGILFDPLLIESMANAIIELLTDHNRRAGFQRKALRRSSAFSWDHTATATLDAYRGL
ncbi:MAG: glycosyltransferase family 4 protein [Chloroflexota bacterium]